MYRPSGTTAVTAVLGALGVFGVIWSKSGEPALPSARPVPSAQNATLDFATKVQLHTGAWRASPPPAVEADSPGPARPDADGTDAGIGPSSGVHIVPGASGRVDARSRLTEPGIAASTLPGSRALAGPAGASVEPVAMRPEDTREELEAVASEVTVKQSFAPSAAGRMGLAGPDAIPRSGSAHAGRGGVAVEPLRLRAHDRPPEAAIPPATPKPKFGPDIFRDLDGVSF